jgi:hypothetical protein
MPPSVNSHRIIVIAGNSAEPIQPTGPPSYVAPHRPAARRIVLIRDGHRVRQRRGRSPHIEAELVRGESGANGAPLSAKAGEMER